MSEEKKVDIDELSLEQLKELAENEGKEAPVETEEDDDEPETKVFRKEIDLGDGSGKQVFEAESLEALVDKLGDAQLHATRKIREQAEQLKKAPTSKVEAKPITNDFSEDEEFVLSQELLSHPSVAMKKMFKQMTGMDISEFKGVSERAKALEVVQAQNDDLKQQEAAATSFTAAHPEYVANVRNGNKLQKALNLLMAENKTSGKANDYPTLLETAFKDLSESGLLELKSDETTVENEDAGVVKPRIVASEEVASSQRKRASGLSSRGRNVTSGKFETTEDDLYNMPLDRLRELAQKST